MIVYVIIHFEILFYLNIFSIKATWVEDAKTTFSSTRFYAILMLDVAYCGPHYSASEG